MQASAAFAVGFLPGMMMVMMIPLSVLQVLLQLCKRSLRRAQIAGLKCMAEISKIGLNTRGPSLLAGLRLAARRCVLLQ